MKKGRFAALRWQDWAVEPDAATLLRVEFPRWVRRLPFGIAAFALGLLLIHWCFGGETVLAPLAIFLFTFAILLLFMRGPLEMNDQIIRQRLPMTRLQFAWDDLQSIHLGDTILLQFEPKKILLPDLEKCEGADKEAMIRLFEAQVAAKGITVTRKRAARR